MIDINLIPAALRKNGKDQDGLPINIPQEVLFGVGVGVIFLLVTVHLVLGATWFVGMGRLSGYKSNWQKVLPDKNTVDGLNKETKDLKKSIAMISDMTSKAAVYWAPKLNAISDDLPKGLWIKRMTLDKVGLTIEGSAVSKNENEINNVSLFLAALKRNERFMKDFSSLEVNSIQGAKTNTVEVTDFSVMAKLYESQVSTPAKKAGR